MGIVLQDRADHERCFFVNFWHWGAIVEAIRSLGVLPDEKVHDLHQPFIGSGLTREEARLVAAAIRGRVLPRLTPDVRLLLDGRTTTEPDEGIFYREDADFKKNYSTNSEVLRQFADYCDACEGFEVL